MRNIHIFFTFTFALMLLQNSQASTTNYTLHAHDVLSEWFSVDPSHDLQMQQTPLADDHLGKKYSLEFTSDDGSQVFGTLALPMGYDLKDKQQIKLALMLHAMGTDQYLWFDTERAIKTGLISAHLRNNGFAVLVLDARLHGARKINGMGPKEIITKARSPHRRLYNDMIIGSVRDYRLVLNWIMTHYPSITTETAAIGYSMGAQMSLLLAAYEPSIDYVLSLVPPYISVAQSPVAPRQHVSKIKTAKVLLLAAKQDPYSTEAEYQQVFDLIATDQKELHFFNSGHRLPDSYRGVVLDFIDAQMVGKSHE